MNIFFKNQLFSVDKVEIHQNEDQSKFYLIATKLNGQGEPLRYILVESTSVDECAAMFNKLILSLKIAGTPIAEI